MSHCCICCKFQFTHELSVMPDERLVIGSPVMEPCWSSKAAGVLQNQKLLCRSTRTGSWQVLHRGVGYPGEPPSPAHA